MFFDLIDFFPLMIPAFIFGAAITFAPIIILIVVVSKKKQNNTEDVISAKIKQNMTNSPNANKANNTTKCPYCGSSNPADFKQCKSCGAKLDK